MLNTTRSSGLVQEDNDNKVVGSGRDKNLFKSKKSKNAKFGIQTRIGAMREPTFLTSYNREAFNKLRQVFTKALIFQHFDLEYYIRIETDVSGYVIGRILSQLTSDHLTSNQLTFDQGQ